MKKWIIKGSKVLVTAGNDKGKVGDVLSVKGNRILIQGVNIRKKHQKRREQNAPSEIIEIEVPIHISNVSLCDQAGKKIRVKLKHELDGSKELYYLDLGKEVHYRNIRKARK
ncbi:MAG: 50S ribosomal protein L24 [Simkaniaceae bacterium]|nr:50S ribosomal protein L24 [Simkaniaceae bacterium]